MAIDVRLSETRFAPEVECAGFAAAHPAAGGVASFVGQVRGGGGVEALELSHYPPLTLPEMRAMAGDAAARWALEGLLIIHRVGLMRPGEPIVLAAAAARHRREALAAVDFAMDQLKCASWLWKRERRGGVWHWVEPRGQDYADRARWR